MPLSENEFDTILDRYLTEYASCPGGIHGIATATEAVRSIMDMARAMAKAVQQTPDPSDAMIIACYDRIVASWQNQNGQPFPPPVQVPPEE